MADRLTLHQEIHALRKQLNKLLHRDHDGPSRTVTPHTGSTKTEGDDKFSFFNVEDVTPFGAIPQDLLIDKNEVQLHERIGRRK
jgi:hypothetical protein